MDLGLAGKAVVITGAAGQVGRATALAFAREGARLALAGRTASALEGVAREAEALGTRAIPVPTDITDDGSVSRLIARAHEVYGRVDVLVNNASVGVLGDFLALTDADWMHRIDVKLMGYIRCIRAVIPGMQRQGGGRIVNVGGIPFHPVTPTNTAHMASNGGIVHVARLLAGIYAPDRILINTVHPTTMAQGTGKLEAEQMHGGLAMRIGRPLLPEDVAKAILFFASNLAECVTGQELAVEGGQTAGMGY
jgi:3-oxoacyl-[acyl-carrier protein] reductase